MAWKMINEQKNQEKDSWMNDSFMVTLADKKEALMDPYFKGRAIILSIYC